MVLRRWLAPVIALAMLSVSMVGAQETAPAAHDGKFLANYLEETSQGFLKSIQGVSDAQWKFKPGPDRWSIAEVAEHITKSEVGLGKTVEDQLAAPALSADKLAASKDMDDKIMTMVTDRSRKAEAPPQLRPNQEWPSRDELVKTFQASRKAHIELAKAKASEMRKHGGAGPGEGGGVLDSYQWMLLISAHSRRHTAQIEEVKADPNYPKN